MPWLRAREQRDAIEAKGTYFRRMGPKKNRIEMDYSANQRVK